MRRAQTQADVIADFVFRISVAVCAGVLACSAGCGRKQATKPSKHAADAVRDKRLAAVASHQLTPDPVAPFSIHSSVIGAVTPGEEVEVMLTLTATAAVSAAQTSLRGVDGLRIVSDAERKHGVLSRGQSVAHSFTLVADPGVHGLVAVDIGWQGERGRQSATLALPVHAKGAKPRLEALGRIERDDKGNPVEVMPAQVR